MSEQERADVDRGANEIIYKPVDDLVPYVNNAKIHHSEQISAIAASIKEFGFNNPILLDRDNGVIAGHGRLLAAKKLKLKQVPCVELSHMSDAQRRAYILADNRLAEVHTEWDMDLVSNELEALELEGFDIELTGFDDSMFLDDDEELDADAEQGEKVPLSDRFLIPPFSVLNAREGWWQSRKKSWLALGISSELGRGGNLIPNGGGQASRDRYAKQAADVERGV